MRRWLELGFLFRVVAGLELAYAVTGLLPPDLLSQVTGWQLTADGQWVAKLVALALAAQAWTAWTLRHNPDLGVAKALAFYQVASATADWVMWLALANDNVFASGTAKVLVVFAIPSHYALGLLLITAVRRARLQEATT